MKVGKHGPLVLQTDALPTAPTDHDMYMYHAHTKPIEEQRSIYAAIINYVY